VKILALKYLKLQIKNAILHKNYCNLRILLPKLQYFCLKTFKLLPSASIDAKILRQNCIFCVNKCENFASKYSKLQFLHHLMWNFCYKKLKLLNFASFGATFLPQNIEISIFSFN